MLVLRGFGTHDFHQFDFIKLMQPNQPSGILAVAASFPTETGGIGTVANGQIFVAEDVIPIQVGDGNFCRRG